MKCKNEKTFSIKTSIKFLTKPGVKKADYTKKMYHIILKMKTKLLFNRKENLQEKVSISCKIKQAFK